MLHVEVDTSALLRRLDAVKERIVNFGTSDMPAELTSWQIEDMHRHWPNTSRPDDHTAETDIWPRSRRSREHRRERHQRRVELHTLPVLRTTSPIVKGVRRPILRPELFAVLCQR